MQPHPSQHVARLCSIPRPVIETPTKAAAHSDQADAGLIIRPPAWERGEDAAQSQASSPSSAIQEYDDEQFFR